MAILGIQLMTKGLITNIVQTKFWRNVSKYQASLRLVIEFYILFCVV